MPRKRVTSTPEELLEKRREAGRKGGAEMRRRWERIHELEALDTGNRDALPHPVP